MAIKRDLHVKMYHCSLHLPKQRDSKHISLNVLIYCHKETVFPVVNVYPLSILRPSHSIWWQRSGSTLDLVMACCRLTAPNHHLKQSGLIISKFHWQSSRVRFTGNTSTINHWNQHENYLPRMSIKFPRADDINKLLFRKCSFGCSDCTFSRMLLEILVVTTTSIKD